MRTLQIGMEWLPDSSGSGVGRMLNGLMSYLPGEDVSVSGLVTSETYPMSSKPSPHIFASPSASVFERLRKLRAAMQHRLMEDDPHLIAAHFALYALPIYATSFDGPVVVHFHGPWALESKAEGEHVISTLIKGWIERFVYRRAQRFIVLSDAFRSILHIQYQIPHSLIRVVPGGVDADRFATPYSPPEARAQLGWPTNRPILLAVRRLVRRTGLTHLIASMEHVRNHHPEALLLIAGKGPLRDKLIATIRSKNLEHHVRLLGFVPDEDLPLAYRAANLSIVPTIQHEGFGLITIESLAAGTPVLVTPIGGLPETVRDLSEELILPDASVAALQEGIGAALNGDLHLPDAETCRNYARRRFDWPVIARQVRQVYEEVV